MTNTWWQDSIPALDETARNAALTRQTVLTKPAGSLGRLETLAVKLAAMQGRAEPDLAHPWISVFAADHGIAAAGVSAYPREVTLQMVANFAAGGAAICVLARHIGARFEVIDVGVAGDTSAWPDVVQAKTVNGTASFLEEPAMSEATVDSALAAGREAVARAVAAGADCFIAGEMGIGNTTSATALACLWLERDPEAMTGAGTGLDDAGIRRKAGVVRNALALHRTMSADPKSALARLGGAEIAAMAGAYVAAAQARLPVIVDGYISSVAALAATRLNPGAAAWFLFGHESAEKAHRDVLAALGGQPVLALGLRLGEGSGAAAAFPVIQAACRLHSRMATFAEAGVSDREA
ncbi:nicotinate-nucleotide--dimethylbenzimidazole phosphoribosyltransferase [Paludibacterium paludis]|uniref:Nicotinate-nucleotide--dimethylbenzimidazole phosphoribosyltransferase n=1 Tax=Paludibacterium paludis TaxID=1225769 RepID=A0A918NY84_9NEIS|nr:nicotinate-nucleotide--dimethylbenzimidazole phosphoribosyltransferase [Paludibacterium paludis]GGY05360.1 nicotinate-nucleotide--dimethylbenzimidazole phosphoribosyltransferase [Paludibacterium paludis]